MAAMKVGGSLEKRVNAIRRLLACAALGLLSLGFAGCDKCGNRIRLNTPAIQHACEYDVPSAQ